MCYQIDVRFKCGRLKGTSYVVRTIKCSKGSCSGEQLGPKRDIYINCGGLPNNCRTCNNLKPPDVTAVLEQASHRLSSVPKETALHAISIDQPSGPPILIFKEVSDGQPLKPRLQEASTGQPPKSSKPRLQVASTGQLPKSSNLKVQATSTSQQQQLKRKTARHFVRE